MSVHMCVYTLQTCYGQRQVKCGTGLACSEWTDRNLHKGDDERDKYIRHLLKGSTPRTTIEDVPYMFTSCCDIIDEPLQRCTALLSNRNGWNREVNSQLKLF